MYGRGLGGLWYRDLELHAGALIGLLDQWCYDRASVYGFLGLSSGVLVSSVYGLGVGIAAG